MTHAPATHAHVEGLEIAAVAHHRLDLPARAEEGAAPRRPPACPTRGPCCGGIGIRFGSVLLMVASSKPVCHRESTHAPSFPCVCGWRCWQPGTPQHDAAGSSPCWCDDDDDDDDEEASPRRRDCHGAVVILPAPAAAALGPGASSSRRGEARRPCWSAKEEAEPEEETSRRRAWVTRRAVAAAREAGGGAGGMAPRQCGAAAVGRRMMMSWIPLVESICGGGGPGVRCRSKS
jgi:hypothetical protein